MGSKIVIIGGVAAGPKTAARARRRDPGAEITLIERGELLSYAGCGMPFYIEGIIEDVQELLCTTRGIMRDASYFKQDKDVTVLTRTEATKINRAGKKVTVRELETGRTYDIPYDKLVLAVGASPFIPRMGGLELKGVYHLYNPGDAKAIRGALESGVKEIAIIGGGLIGMEVCGAFVNRLCNVTVLEMMDRLVPALLDTDMSLLLERYLKDRGVNVQTGSRITEVLDDGAGKVAGVSTTDGRTIKAEMVVVAIGVKPNVDLAREAGLEIGKTGAIAVDERLRTSDPDIYAGGDCVENQCIITGRKIYAPLGSTANKHGRILGDNITGGDTRFPGVAATTVFKVLDYNVGKTGLNTAQALELGYDVVTSVAPKGDCSHYYPGAKSFITKLITDKKTGKVLGAQVLGPGEGVKRIDVVATALAQGLTAKDVADLDLGYAPPYSTAIDPIAHAANIVRNKIDGLAHGISCVDLKKKMDGDGDFVLLDVRSEGEVRDQPLRDPRVTVIPVEELRDRADELSKDREIIAFCRTSVRAYEAERMLRGKGFNDVKFLDGSLNAWPYEF